MLFFKGRPTTGGWPLTSGKGIISFSVWLTDERHRTIPNGISALTSRNGHKKQENYGAVANLFGLRALRLPALGIIPPWLVKRCDFYPDRKQLDIYIDFTRGGEFTCCGCGREGNKAYDTVGKKPGAI